MSPFVAGELEALCNEAAARTRVPARHFHKDYWVTAVLRRLVNDMQDQFVFKGGTSLSKAFGYLDRFSEDIDLLITVDASEPTQVEATIDAMRDAMLSVLGAPKVREERRELGLGADIRVSFPTPKDLPSVSGVSKSIKLEPGIRGGPNPVLTRSIAPMLASPMTEIADRADMQQFDVVVLHPGRTLIEKLLAVHHLSVQLASGSKEKLTGRESRHFYDIHRLLERDDGDVMTLLSEPETVGGIVQSCVEISTHWFGAPDLAIDNFADSPAFIDASIADVIEQNYNSTCAELCYPGTGIPTWSQICQLVEQRRDFLSI